MRPFPTGQTKKQLKAEYSLVDGKLYRRATPDDVEITASDIAPAPDWVLDRAPEATSPSVDQIIEQELSKARDSYREIQTAQSSEVQAEPKSKGGN
jgi:hypothetical protein